MTLKRYATAETRVPRKKSGRPRKGSTTYALRKAADAAGSDPAAQERLERLQRAALVIFELGFTKPENWPLQVKSQPDEPPRAVLWVTEVVPYHGTRQAALRQFDTPLPPSWDMVATAILDHLETLGVCSPSKRFVGAVMLAAEVLPRLPLRWRLNGRDVVQFLDRDLSGADVVRMSRESDGE